MNKNTLIFSIAVLSLSACQHYSNEMTFFYDDENAAPEAMAAPTQKVSSKELVIPQELRNPQPTAPEKNTVPQTANNLLFDENEDDDILPPTEVVSMQSQPQSLSVQEETIVKTTETQTQTETETQTIPVTYGNNLTEQVETNQTTSTATHYNSADITPKVYAIAATRVTNKMLDDTQKIYKQQGQKPKLLVLEAKKINPNLPDGLHYANKTIYNIIDGSQNFMMVSNLDDADYVLDVSVDAYPNQGIDTPIIVYTLFLKDKDGKEIDSWQQDIRQLQNDDKSWW